MGPYLEKKLNELLDLPIVGQVRGSHFMMCVENVADKTTREHLPEEANIGKRISDHCEKLGLIVRPLGALNVISPPLILTEAQVDELVGLLRKGIEAAMHDLRKEGLLKA
jgi:adenosylmethionine-8-amino-7-oxononanoate aminotransferase